MANIFNPAKPHFRVGQKALYLPQAVVTLVASPTLPPRYAKFHVPINWNKLDLRDYLFHAYKVRALSIRSWVYQAKPQQKDGAYHRWYMPQAKKRMIVEMDKPFVWPEVPEDFAPWEKTSKDASDAERKRNEDEVAPDNALLPTPQEEVKSLREQAKELLEGKKKWQPTWVQMAGMRTRMDEDGSVAVEEQAQVEEQTQSKPQRRVR